MTPRLPPRTVVESDPATVFSLVFRGPVLVRDCFADTRRQLAVCATALVLCLAPSGVSAQTQATNQPAFSSIELAYGINTLERRRALQEIDAARDMERWQEMSAACSNAVALFPSPIYFQRWLVAAERQSNRPLVTRVYRLYMDACPDYRDDLYGPWSEAMTRDGRDEEALATLREWSRSDAGTQTLLWKTLTGLLIAGDRLDEAESAWAEALRKSPSKAMQRTAEQGQASIEERKAAIAKAIMDAEQEAVPLVKQGSPQSRIEALNKLVGLLRKHQRVDSYLRGLDLRIERNERALDALLILLPLSYVVRDEKREIECCRKLLQREDIDEVTIERCHYIVSSNRGTPADRLLAMQRMAALPGQRQRWLPFMANLCLELGRTNDALPLLVEAVTETSTADWIAFNAVIAYGAGFTNHAAKWMELGLKKYPPDGSKNRFAWLLINFGRPQEALDLILTMPSSHTWIGQRDEVLGDLDKIGFRSNIVARLRKRATERPTDPWTWADCAKFHHQVQDFARAGEYWKRAVDLAPTMHFLKGWTATAKAKRDNDMMIAALGATFRAFPKADTARTLCPLLADAGRGEEAIGIQRQVLSLASNQVETVAARLGMAALCVKIGREEDAVRDLDALQGVELTDASRMESAAIMAEVESARRHRAMVARAKEKADASPSDPAAQRAAAQALRLFGRSAEAAEYYRRALAAQDAAPTRWDLAFALTSAGLHQEAVEQYRQLLGRELTPQERETAVKSATEGLVAAGEPAKALAFLMEHMEKLTTPVMKKWAESQVRSLRDGRN